MATAKKTTQQKSPDTTTQTKSSARKSAGTKTRTRSTAANRRTGTAKKRSASTGLSESGKARKTGRKTARGQAWTEAHSDNPSSTGHGKAKKEPAKQTSQCWPGYEPVPGKARGTKGSCKPKAHQTGAEKKSDAMAASASKLRKAGGNKARANRAK